MLTLDLEPQTLEEAVAEYLGNSTGLISLYDAERELMGKVGGQVPIEVFRHINGGRGIISKKGKASIQFVASDIAGHYQYLNLDEQEVRNGIIDMLFSGMTKTEMKLLITENRVKEHQKMKEHYEHQKLWQ